MERLFSGPADIFGILELQKRQVQKTVQALDPDYLLKASEEDLVKSLSQEHILEVPVVDDERIAIEEVKEAQIDVDGLSLELERYPVSVKASPREAQCRLTDQII